MGKALATKAAVGAGVVTVAVLSAFAGSVMCAAPHVERSNAAEHTLGVDRTLRPPRRARVLGTAGGSRVVCGDLC